MEVRPQCNLSFLRDSERKCEQERKTHRERENGASLFKVEELVDFTERDIIYSFSTRIVIVISGGMDFESNSDVTRYFTKCPQA